MGDKDAGVWAQLKERLPYARTAEEKEKRIAQWQQIDVNGNGILSLAEIDKGMRDVVCLPVLFDLKPVLMRAFQAAKSLAPASSKSDDDYIQKSEYRPMLQYLRQYYEVWLAFDRLDKDGNRRISYEEFEKAKHVISKWGVDMTDPKAQWQACDSNSGGMVLFVEFADWAIKQNLDLEDDDD